MCRSHRLWSPSPLIHTSFTTSHGVSSSLLQMKKTGKKFSFGSYDEGRGLKCPVTKVVSRVFGNERPEVIRGCQKLRKDELRPVLYK